MNRNGFSIFSPVNFSENYLRHDDYHLTDRARLAIASENEKSLDNRN